MKLSLRQRYDKVQTFPTENPQKILGISLFIKGERERIAIHRGTSLQTPHPCGNYV